MSAFSVNVLNLQNQVIERLTSDEVIDKRVGKNSVSGLQKRYHFDEEHIELKLHELYRYLKDFTIFVEDVNNLYSLEPVIQTFH